MKYSLLCGFAFMLLTGVSNQTLANEIYLNETDKEFLKQVQTATSSAELEDLFQKGAYINTEDENGKNALMSAITDNGNLEIIEYLLRNGADIPLVAIIGSPKVAEAAKGNESIISYYFNDPLTVKDKALFYAAMYTSKPEVIKWLVSKGADINIRGYKDSTPLMLAALRNENTEILETIIKLGGDVTKKNRDNHTALWNASGKNENPEIIKLLIKHGARIENSVKLLEHASYNPNAKVIQTLIKLGANVKEKDAYTGNAVIAIAAQNRSSEVLEILLESGADVDATQFDKLNAMMRLCQHPYPKMDMLKTLVKYGADVNARDKARLSALHYCMQYNQQPDAIRFLLSQGANIHATDKAGRSCLYYLLSADETDEERVQAQLAVLHEVLIYDTDFISRFSNKDLLQYAIINKADARVIKFLLENGADVNSIAFDNADWELLKKYQKPVYDILKTYQKK